MLISILALALGAATLVLAAPGPTACATIEARANILESASGVYFDKTLTSAERKQFASLLEQGRARIEERFGPPIASPVVVRIKDRGALWPFRFNSYGSTSFVGPRACVVVGPDGANIDVVSHELMHAELFERVGWWRRLTGVPTWFDEGVGMQVDYRTRYGLAPDADSSAARTLESPREFFVADDKELTRHYAASRAEVARWLASVGGQDLFAAFARIRAGQPFDSVVK